VTPQENKATVEEFIQGLFTRCDLSALELLTEDYVDHAPFPGATADRESMRTAATVIRAAFPDWASRIDHVIAEGDLVAEHFTATGTHSGAFMGIEPTGRRAALHGVNVFRLRDGLIAERWGVLDFPGLLAQLRSASAERSAIVA